MDRAFPPARMSADRCRTRASTIVPSSCRAWGTLATSAPHRLTVADARAALLLKLTTGAVCVAWTALFCRVSSSVCTFVLYTPVRSICGRSSAKGDSSRDCDSSTSSPARLVRVAAAVPPGPSARGVTRSRLPALARLVRARSLRLTACLGLSAALPGVHCTELQRGGARRRFAQ